MFSHRWAGCINPIPKVRGTFQKRVQEELEGGKTCCEILFRGHYMVVAHMNSEQLWLSAEDSYYLSTKLHKINQVEKNVSKRWEEFQRH